MKKLLIAAAALLAVCFIGGVVLMNGAGEQTLYTRVEDSAAQKLEKEQSGMTYEYTLPAYTADGEEKDVSFRTARLLRAGAYLKLTLQPVRGVTDWEEVPAQALPEAAARALTP